MSSFAGFLGLEPTSDPTHWRLPLHRNVLTGAGALHGGAGLAAAVEAAAGSLQRPVVRATAHYLSHVGPPAVVAIHVTSEVAGYHTTQAHVTLRSESAVILTATMTLGTRSHPATGRWVTRPDVPAPDNCPERVLARALPGTLGEVCEFRVASGRQYGDLDGTPGSGTTATWCRLPGGFRPPTAGQLAFAGDFPLSALSDATGTPSTGTSLDHTIRIVELAATEWILCETHVDAIASGFAHMSTRLWSQDASLLGLASQTLALRPMGEDGLATVRQRRIVHG
jgi:acyl-CoA thioesterase